MPYNYRTQRPIVFTEDGQVMFLKIRDRTKELIASAGAATCERIISGCSGNIWDMHACVDRLVELGEIHEIQNNLSTAGQHRVFMSFKE